MFNDPFLCENVKINRTDELLEFIETLECPLGELFYGTGYSSADSLTPHIVNAIFQEILEVRASNAFKHRLFLKKIWVNVNPPGGYQPRHTHSEFAVAGTYYLKVPEKSGDITFFHPSPHVECLQRLKPFYTFTHTHVPCVGDLLIWPGYMSHEVSYNYSNKNRITVSFCLDI